MLHSEYAWFLAEASVHSHISPHCDTTMGILGLLLGPVGTFSIFLSTKSPSMTRPEKNRLSHLKAVRVSVYVCV